MSKKPFVVLAVVLLLSSTSLFAQGEEATDEGDNLYQITPKQGGWEIEELFKTIAQYTGQSIVYDPKSPQIARKVIEFVGTQTVPRDELFSWFQSLLSFQRLILVPVGPRGHEQWMALDTNSPQITNRPIFVPETDIIDWEDRDGVYIVSTITVRNLTDTSRARNALAQLATRTVGRINDVPGNQAFVVGDFAPVVASMYRLLKAMDVKPLEYEAVAETYLLENAVAEEVEPIILDLLQQSTPGRPTARNQAPGIPEKPDPRIIADLRQDAIIVFAVPEDQVRIAKLIQLLDQKVVYKRGNIHFVPVKNTNAAELADVLTELIRGTGLTPGSPRRPTNRSAGPASPGTLTGGQSEPIIVADTRTNSLLIQATQTQMDDLSDIIAQIDIPRDQVLVEAALIELTIDDLLRFGVEMASATNQGNPDERTFFAVSRGANLTTLTDSDGDGVPDINVPNFGSSGLTAGIFDNSRFPLVVQAVTTNSNARALSLPSVVVEDGSQAVMTVQDQVPYQEQNTDPAGNTNLTYAFTDAAITLDISPHISSDNYLRLHINQTVESFRPSIAVGEPPPKTSRQIETDIVIPDGYTVVMGGLINKIESENEEGIPFLKDIPLLGYLFSSRRSSSSTTSLFLFVTPHIIRNPQNDFTEYHKISWQRKLRADELLNRTVSFYGARFKDDPDVQQDETLEKIQDSGFLDNPRLKQAPERRMSPEEAKQRYEELTHDRQTGGTTTTGEPNAAKDATSGEPAAGASGEGTSGEGGAGEEEKK